MNNNTKTVFYKKVGRRYAAIAEYDDEYMNSFSKGAHLVICHPGSSSRRYRIDPDYASLIAAGRVAEDAISKSIMDALELRLPSSLRKTMLTNEQKIAWQQLIEAFGQDAHQLEWPSVREAAEAGVTAMMEEAKHLLENDAVRRAWEHYQLVCALTKQQESAH